MSMTVDIREPVAAANGTVRDSAPSEKWQMLSHIRQDKSGRKSIAFYVPTMHCAGCMQKIERAVRAISGVVSVRANLTAHRVAVAWNGSDDLVFVVQDRLNDVGFNAAPYAVENVETVEADVERRYLKALAVAGFGAANIMLLSVAVWSGVGGSMINETRQLFHWISALIAIPTVAYSGRIFFESAWRSVSVGELNMDVPISLAILLSVISSLVQVVIGGHHAYFDASVTLLFFLLIGRYLDQHMRGRAGSAVRDLLSLRATSSIRMRSDGSTELVAPDDLDVGDVIHIPPGFPISADGRVVEGVSEIDVSLMTGEGIPEYAGVGSTVNAGTTNLTGALKVEVVTRSSDSVLSQITDLVEAAENAKGTYRRMSDRIARLYAPAVHIIAAVTFAAWLAVGAGWNDALMTSVAVLIITCPCAVALAIPVVNIVAVGRLFRNGILCKSDDGLERTADIEAIIFDKTGTLTDGKLNLTDSDHCDPKTLAVAASLAQSSTHPLCHALVKAARSEGIAVNAIETEEVPGKGMKAQLGGVEVRLGSANWIGVDERSNANEPSMWLRVGQEAPARFSFVESIRPMARETVDDIVAKGLPMTILSGDHKSAVDRVAGDLAISDCRARQSPLDKEAFVRERMEYQQILYVGDGINDAPAAQAAFVSISPSGGSQIGQNAADFVFQKDDLSAISEILNVARSTRSLVKQNLVLAFAYNAVAIPAAMFGFATPLVAAVAMSSSSLLVTLNALRLHEKAPERLKG